MVIESNNSKRIVNENTTLNPYTLMFGYPPTEIIDRSVQAEQILEAYQRERPASYVNLVTGVRGSGKTVFITQIADRLKGKKNWIVIDLNVQRDMLTSLAAKLYGNRILRTWFDEAQINLSAFGLGVNIKGAPPIMDIEQAVARMLQSIGKHQKRVLITIDEAGNSKETRIFASAFQIFLRERLPVFLIMTGLFKDIDRLRNAKGMTFLERAPRTYLAPLNTDAIAINYAENITIKMSEAIRLAKLTKGYSFAFQVIGYFMCENPDHPKRALDDAKEYLYEFAYQKIWMETSEKDKALIHAIADVPTGEVAKIKGLMNYTSNQFNPYRDRLMKAGIIYAPATGVVEFSLPYFDEFTKQMRDLA